MDTSRSDLSAARVRYRQLLRGMIVRAEEKATRNAGLSKVVVCGGSGFIGSELSALLRRQGLHVVLVSRSQHAHTFPYTDADVITWDGLQQKGLPTGTRAVVNLAGENVFNPMRRWNESFKSWSVETDHLVYDSRINTARMIVSAISKSVSDPSRKPDVFVQITGIGTLPPNTMSDAAYPDDCDKRGNDFLAKLAGDWEKASALPPEVADKVRYVCIRPGMVLGRNGGIVKSLYAPFFFGLGSPTGSGSQPMPWIHVKDLCGLIAHCIETDSVSGFVNGVAPETISSADFVRAFAASLWRPAFLTLPDFVWTAIFGEERAKIMFHGHKVAASKKAIDSGFVFRFGTIKEACEEFAPFFYVDQDIGKVTRKN